MQNKLTQTEQKGIERARWAELIDRTAAREVKK